GLAVPGQRYQLDRTAEDRRGQHVVHSRSNEQGDHAFGDGHEGEQQNANGQPQGIRPNVAEKAPQLWRSDGNQAEQSPRLRRLYASAGTCIVSSQAAGCVAKREASLKTALARES